MDERVARLEALVADLRERVADLETRLAPGDHAAAAFSRRPESTHDPLTAVAEIGAGSVQQWLALVGRTLVVLGGAYLLRAITESHVVLPQVGVALGLIYGAPWLALASRAEGRGAHLDALCHALSTALIGYPLVWEATVRFQVLTPGQSAGLLAALTGAALVLASRRQLQSLAWVVMFGALGSALGLAAATSAWVPYTLVAIGVGLATHWLGYLHRWVEIRWPAAVAANFMLFVATGRAGAHGGIASVVWLQALMLVGYLGTVTIRTVLGPHRLVPFEVAQSAGALAVGFGGLVYLLSGSSLGPQILAAISLLIGAGAYAAAFAFSEGRRPAANFFFQSVLGFFFVAAGLAVGLGAPIAAFAYAALGCVTLAFARQHRSLTLVLHSTSYAVAATIASGLLTTATLAMATPGAAGIASPGALTLASLAALIAIAALPVRETREQWPYVVPVARCIVAALVIWTAAGTTVAITLAGLRGSIDASQLSTLRTIVLVGSAVAAAAAGSRPVGREAAWLTYPLLLVAGLKLVFVDFMQGRPTTLFAALAVYGAALIIAPRMLRRVVAASEDPALQSKTAGSEDRARRQNDVVAVVGRGL
jgi:hypothetical protein